MVAQIDVSVRPASLEDRTQLANLIHFEIHVHRHLDWRPPLDWIGYKPYLVAEYKQRIVAALACPPDPPGVAWIRMFAVAAGFSSESAWQALWPEALRQLQLRPRLEWVAAIPLQGWFRHLLEQSGFQMTHRVVMLNRERNARRLAEEQPAEAPLRPMSLDDLPAVEAVDAAAFDTVWRNSQDALELAFRQASLATVAEYKGRLVGYQISTATPMGGHIARLAVHPDFQGRHIGHALLRDVLSQMERRGIQSVTVNTQENNATSLSLYTKSGFRLTGEDYPVYQFALAGDPGL